MVAAVLPLYGKIVTGQAKGKSREYPKRTYFGDLSALKGDFHMNL
jgi:hypothetical protein